MARYLDNREEHIEVKYLYKVWTGVDKRIALPQSLTGRALLPKLDKVEHPVPLTRKIRFSPRIFTWQSSLTYAAAFLLIVALSAAFGRSGGSAPEVLRSETASQMAMEETSENAAPASTQPLLAVPEDGGQGTQPDAEASPGEGSAATSRVEVPDTAQPDSAPAGGVRQGDAHGQPVFEGIGGQNASVLLGQQDAFTYTYRVNDSDPYKAGFPITVNIMDSETGELACSIDIPEMLTIEEYYRYGDELALVGSSQNGVMLNTYDISIMDEPVSVFQMEQPGELLDTHIYKNVIHMLTLAQDGDRLDCEVVELIGATADTSCVITAINIEDLETNQKAFTGAGADVVLYDLNAYLNYTGEVTEENETGRYGAHIRLDGMDITIGNNS